MAQNVRLKFNRKAFGEILNSQSVQELVDRTGADIAHRANVLYRGPRVSTGREPVVQDYRSTEGLHGKYGRRGGGRPVCYAHPHGWLARKDQALNHTLETSLRG